MQDSDVFAYRVMFGSQVGGDLVSACFAECPFSSDEGREEEVAESV